MRKFKLLLIEGEPRVREAMACVLRAHFGVEAVLAVPSLAAALHEPVGSFDLVIADWLLPDITGPLIMESLRGAGARAVIVMTAANVGAVASEAVLHGAIDFIVRYPSGEYLATLPVAVEKSLVHAQLKRERDALSRQLIEQNETLEQLLRSLEEAAATDPLTGLYNRRHFVKVLDQMFDDAVRGGADLACLMLDMDGFKLLNDTFGHLAGDHALVSAARAIRDSLRRMDAAARYGGDEFVILLPRSHALEGAAVARRIREAYAHASHATGDVVLPPGQAFPTGMSVGVATLAIDRPRTAEQLVAAADAALYRAKRLGRDRVFVSTDTPKPTPLAVG